MPLACVATAACDSLERTDTPAERQSSVPTRRSPRELAVWSTCRGARSLGRAVRARPQLQLRPPPRRSGSRTNMSPSSPRTPPPQTPSQCLNLTSGASAADRSATYWFTASAIHRRPTSPRHKGPRRRRQTPVAAPELRRDQQRLRWAHRAALSPTRDRKRFAAAIDHVGGICVLHFKSELT